MLKFSEDFEKFRVSRNISNEYVGYAHRSYFQGINKFRFHPIQGNCLDAHEMHLISEFLTKRNKVL